MSPSPSRSRSGSRKSTLRPPEKSKSPLRWLVLLLACLMLLGSYYCFDIPSALKTQLDDYMGDQSDYEFKFGLLYTLYAAPNVILPFFGGYLVDRWGVRASLLLFSTTLLAGQLLFAFGVSIKSWPIMFLGETNRTLLLLQTRIFIQTQSIQLI